MTITNFPASDSAGLTLPSANRLSFLDLPLEIRQEIYGLIFIPASKDLTLLGPREYVFDKPNGPLHAQILRLNHSIHNEAMDYFQNSFVLKLIIWEEDYYPPTDKKPVPWEFIPWVKGIKHIKLMITPIDGHCSGDYDDVDRFAEIAMGRIPTDDSNALHSVRFVLSLYEQEMFAAALNWAQHFAEKISILLGQSRGVKYHSKLSYAGEDPGIVGYGQIYKIKGSLSISKEGNNIQKDVRTAVLVQQDL